MQNALRTFTHDLFNSIRAFTDENGEPLFVASDIAKALGYRNAPDMTRNIDDEDKGTRQVRTVTRGMQQVTVITESGLYTAIFASKLKAAKQFRRWVTKDVLPAIRKDGMYVQGEEKVATGDWSDDDFIEEALRRLKAKADRLQAERDQLAETFETYIVNGTDKTIAQVARFLRDNGFPININQVKPSLVRLGLLYSRRKYNGKLEYRVYRGGKAERYFGEKLYHYGDDPEAVEATIIVKPEGAQYLLNLAREGKLTRLC